MSQDELWAIYGLLVVAALIWVAWIERKYARATLPTAAPGVAVPPQKVFQSADADEGANHG